MPLYIAYIIIYNSVHPMQDLNICTGSSQSNTATALASFPGSWGCGSFLATPPEHGNEATTAYSDNSVHPMLDLNGIRGSTSRRNLAGTYVASRSRRSRLEITLPLLAPTLRCACLSRLLIRMVPSILHTHAVLCVDAV